MCWHPMNQRLQLWVIVYATKVTKNHFPGMSPYFILLIIVLTFPL